MNKPSRLDSKILRYCSFALAQRFFHPPALRDVDQQAAQQFGLVVFGDDGYRLAQPHAAAIGGQHAVFTFVGAQGGGGRRAGVHHPITIVGMQVIAPESRFGQPPFHRVPQNALGRGADERKQPGLRIAFPYDAVDRVDQLLVLLLRLAQRGFGLLVLGNVEPHADAADDVAAGRAQRLDMILHIPPAPQRFIAHRLAAQRALMHSQDLGKLCVLGRAKVQQAASHHVLRAQAQRLQPGARRRGKTQLGVHGPQERRHLFHQQPQPRLIGAQFIGGPFPLGDILHIGDAIQQPAVLVPHRRQIHHHREGGAVLADMRRLHDGMAGLIGRLDESAQLASGAGRVDAGDRQARQFLDRVAVHLGIGGIHHLQRAAVGAPDRHAPLRVLEDVRPALQRLLGAFALGNVLGDRQARHDRAVIVAQRQRPRKIPVSAELCFKHMRLAGQRGSIVRLDDLDGVRRQSLPDREAFQHFLGQAHVSQAGAIGQRIAQIGVKHENSAVGKTPRQRAIEFIAAAQLLLHVRASSEVVFQTLRSVRDPFGHSSLGHRRHVQTRSGPGEYPIKFS